MKHCPECGKKLPQPNPKHCPECGAALAGAQQASAPQAKAAQKPAAHEAPAKQNPLRRYWAWVVVIIISAMLVLPIASYYDDSNQSAKRARAEKETRLTIQLEEEEELLFAQRKIMTATTIQQYASALQTDGIAIQSIAQRVGLVQNASTEEQKAVALEFATALRDTVEHAQAMRVFVMREKKRLIQAGTNTAQVLSGIDTTEKTFTGLAASMLDSMEQEAAQSQEKKEAFAETIGVLKSIG